jgi:diguanylate cyclase (GGDEF)-like protein
MLYELTKKLSITDELTKVYNYRYLQSQLGVEVRRAERYRRPLSLIMIDIDNFKSYNDEFGHLRGDIALFEVAKIIQENCRSVDIVARYGGEEFVVILPETTDEGAKKVGERIRKAVSSHQFLGKQNKRTEKFTVSVGVSPYWDGASQKEIIQKADEALYQAKRFGKNMVC